MFCTQCGHKNEDGIRFCTNCGAPLSTCDSAKTADANDVQTDISGEDEPADEATEGREPEQETPEPSPEPEPKPETEPAPSLEPEAISVPFPTPEPEAIPTLARERSRGGRRIAAVAVAFVAIVAIVAVVIIGGLDKGVTTVAFTSNESVSVTRTARIVPTASDGTPLEHYIVRVVSATDEDSEAINPSEEYVSIEVTGTGGFTMGDIVPEQEGGTYVLEIDDGTKTQTTPPIAIDDENGVSNEVQIEQMDDTEDTEVGDSEASAAPTGTEDETDEESAVRGADTLFLEKIEELEDQYGEPSLEVTEYEHAVGIELYESMLYGVVYAELVDFGDGKERLVVMWNDPEEEDKNEDGDTANACKVEVWEYDEDVDQLVALLNDGDGLALYEENKYLEYYESNEGNTLLRIYAYETIDDSPFGISTETYYGLDESGEFGIYWTATIVPTYASDTGTTANTFYVNSEEVSKYEYDASRQEAFSDSTGYIANAVFEYGGLTSAEGTSDYSGLGEDTDEFGATWFYPAATAQTVTDTIALLEERIGTAANDS